MAQSTRMGLGPHPVPSQLFVELLYFMLLLLPKLFAPGEFLEVQLPDNTPPDSEYVLVPLTDAPSSHNLKPSQS